MHLFAKLTLVFALAISTISMVIAFGTANAAAKLGGCGFGYQHYLSNTDENTDYYTTVTKVTGSGWPARKNINVRIKWDNPNIVQYRTVKTNSSGRFIIYFKKTLPDYAIPESVWAERLTKNKKWSWSSVRTCAWKPE